MSDSDMPEPGGSKVAEGYSIVGPFKQYKVTVRGRRVPLLEAHPVDGGAINLIFDDRIGVLLDVATAESVVPFIADVIRGCLDFKHHWPRMIEIGEVHTDADEAES